MSGYIDENARIADDIHNAYEEGYADGKRDAVVHGYWLMDARKSGFTYRCSCCGATGKMTRTAYTYCPWCGSKNEVTK